MFSYLRIFPLNEKKGHSKVDGVVEKISLEYSLDFFSSDIDCVINECTTQICFMSVDLDCRRDSSVGIPVADNYQTVSTLLSFLLCGSA